MARQPDVTVPPVVVEIRVWKSVAIVSWIMMVGLQMVRYCPQHWCIQTEDVVSLYQLGYLAFFHSAWEQQESHCTLFCCTTAAKVCPICVWMHSTVSAVPGWASRCRVLEGYSSRCLKVGVTEEPPFPQSQSDVAQVFRWQARHCQNIAGHKYNTIACLSHHVPLVDMLAILCLWSFRTHLELLLGEANVVVQHLFNPSRYWWVVWMWQGWSLLVGVAGVISVCKFNLVNRSNTVVSQLVSCWWQAPGGVTLQASRSQTCFTFFHLVSKAAVRSIGSMYWL